MKYIGILIMFVITCVMLPVTLYAQPDVSADPASQRLVPDCGVDCGFNDLIQLAQNLISWLIFIAVPLAAVIFVVAGVMYVTAGGDPGKIKRAHSLFVNVGVGLVIVLGAWLIVYTITNAFLKEGADAQLLG